MAFLYLTAEKQNHNGEPMAFTFKDNYFTATCPICGGNAVLSGEQAAAGQARCFGSVILGSWPKDPPRS